MLIIDRGQDARVRPRRRPPGDDEPDGSERRPQRRLLDSQLLHHPDQVVEQVLFHDLGKVRGSGLRD